ADFDEEALLDDSLASEPEAEAPSEEAEAPELDSEDELPELEADFDEEALLDDSLASEPEAEAPSEEVETPEQDSEEELPELEADFDEEALLDDALESEPEAEAPSEEAETPEQVSEDELPELEADFDEEALLDDSVEEELEASVDEDSDLEDEFPELEVDFGEDALVGSEPEEAFSGFSDDELPEFTEEDVLEDEGEPSLEAQQQVIPELTDEDDLDTLLSEPEAETEIPEVDEAEIEKEFMADFTQEDFDALLSELDSPAEFDATNSEDFEVDFDSLLQDELASEDNPQPSTDIGAEGAEDYLEIEDLLDQSDDLDTDVEPYVGANMDVGLGDFDELLAGENTTDVDLEDEGFAAKLDLAKAYIEIQDYDSAIATLNDVIENGPDSVQAEAESLKSNLTNS
ncbi:FimV/HubP family polar landmark protein, partial [Pseudoalteromonas piscicida]|uniref:FimV/HubP family polar landmark protein n=1 Tax=Pseudoalteromonas piscicida TaxID=43662 RepID=UPI0030A7EC86